MKLSHLITVLVAPSVVKAITQQTEVEKREPGLISDILGILKPVSVTKTAAATSYGFFKPTSFPTLFPKPPSKNETSTSQDADRNPLLPNSAQHRGNWQLGFNINTDYGKKWPTTFKTNRYDWHITNATLSPDGTPQQMLVINGQYPGPLLEGNWGDWFEVTVHNDMKYNGTGIHWHGFRQLNNNPADGVPGITECPIAPGQSKVYRFQATGYGSTWYHSHFSSQYGAGVLGPVIVHGPASANYDIDIGTVQITDWYPLTAFQEDYLVQRLGPQLASNYLVNGHNIKPDGSAGTRNKFQFTPGKKHLMRLMNNGLDHTFKVQLDGHSFLVIATDNTPIVPYRTKELTINVGQRYDVVIAADQPVGNYYLRTIPSADCSANQNNGLGTANAIVSYNGASSSLPVANGTVAVITPGCLDEPIGSLTPIVTGAVDSTGFASQFDQLPVNLQAAALSTGERVFLWYLNGNSLNIDWSYPTIETVADNRTVSSSSNSSAYFPANDNVISLPTEGKWTFWVIQNQFFVPHPMHLHGHDFALLGQGVGTFDPAANLGQLNFVNPPRRDVAQLVALGWTVIAFKTDNPGSWLMHCHIAWHVSGGLALQFLELPAKIPGLYQKEVDGSAFQNNCKSWDQYYHGPQDIYGKTDSGLKKREAEVEAEFEERSVLDMAREHLKRHKFWGKKH